MLRELKIKMPTKTMGVSRKNMPQVSGKDYKDFFEFLKSKGIKYSHLRIRVGKLKAIQKEFHPDGITRSMKSGFHKAKSILISSDNYVIDGNHRWLSVLNSDPSYKMKAVRLQTNAKDSLRMLSQFPKVKYRGIYDEAKPRKKFGEVLAEAAPSPLLGKYRNVKGKDDIGQVYDILLPTFKKIKKKYEAILRKEVNRDKKIRNIAKIKALLKEKDKFVEKVADRGKKINEIGDIVRGAVLFDDTRQAEEFVKKFAKRQRSIVKEVDKKVATTNNSYYGAIHIDIQIDGLTCELQVMSKKLFTYKSAAHDIYDVSRVGGKVSKADTHRSGEFMSRGNTPNARPNKKRNRRWEEFDLSDETLMEMFTWEDVEYMDDWEDVDLTID